MCIRDRYKISDLLGAAQTNENNIDTMEKQTGSLRLIIIILAVIIGLLVIVVTVMIFKLKAAYEDGYDEYGDDDDEEDDEDMDDEDDDDEDMDCLLYTSIPQLADEFEDYMEKSGKLEINGQSPMMGKIFSESFSQNDTYGNGLDYILVLSLIHI